MRQMKIAALAVLLLSGLSAEGIAQRASARSSIVIEYAEPLNPDHRSIREVFKANRVLEKFRDFFRIFRLPRRLGFKLAGCNGEVNAWYEPDDGIVTVCYEYIHDLKQFAPKEGAHPDVTPEDTIIGPTIDVFLHEAGHALFDMLRIPILGREEDAADQFAAYAMLQLGDRVARRMIAGVAYMYASDAKRETVGTKAFADEHGLPAQRFFNLVCMAYGAKPTVFADAIEKKYLPKERAESCDDEYQQVAFALSRLMGPHMNQAEERKMRRLLKTWTPAARR